VSGRNTPASDSVDGRGRKPKKGKAKANDYEAAAGSKRKRALKSMSATPDMDEDDEEHDSVSARKSLVYYMFDLRLCQKRRKTKIAANPNNAGPDIPPAVRDRMKKAFMECYKSVLACEDETGRKRCELFREVPDRRDYPDYFRIISHPIALSQLRKRGNSNYYKNVNTFREDWRLMFNNARTYNQEGSWVYVDAEEMEKVFNAAWDRVIAGTDFPGALPAPSSIAGGGSGSATGSYASALTPMEEDGPPLPMRGRSGSRKQVLSDEEYLTASDEE
jgi:ATP-dependent helicase STH1/SNF2